MEARKEDHDAFHLEDNAERSAVSQARASDGSSTENGLSLGDGGEDKTESPRDVHGFVWALVVIATISSMFLFGLDQTITADVQPAIIHRFNSINKLPWVSVALLLGASASNLFWGQVYANYNTKWIFLVCFVIFELGSTLCGASPTIDVLIAGRALCGFGGTGMYNGVMTLLSVSTTDQERALYMSIPGLAWGSSTVLGPVVGGAFTVSSAGWRWGFYINLCVGAACLPVFLFLVPSKDPRPNLPWTSSKRFKDIDMLGFLLLTGCFVALLMGINFGGLLYAWKSATIIALFVVAGVLCIVFWIQQIWAIGTNVQTRSFPLTFLRNTTMMVNFFNQTCSATACFLPIYFIPLYFQFVRLDSALQAAIRLLPYMTFLVATVIGEGLVMSKLHVGRFLPWFFVGGALVLIGSALMYTVNADTSTPKIYGYTIILGTGTGAYLQMPFAVAQAKVQPALIPVAVGFTAFAQLAAPAITLSIANSVFLNGATNGVLRVLPDASQDIIQSVVSGTGRDYLDSLGADVRGRVVAELVSSMSKVYILVIISGALTLVCTTFLAIFEKVSSKRAAAVTNEK